MKGLVIREPWIDLILSGQKTWEMRSQSTQIRGRIALIRKGSGLVCGIANLIGTEARIEPSDLAATVERHRIPPTQFDEVAKAGWLVPWVLVEAKPLARLVPYVHRSGAVTWVNLGPEVVTAIVDQLDVAGELPATATQSVVEDGQLYKGNATDSVIVPLTAGNIDNGYIKLHPAIHLVPNDAIGGSNKATAAAGTITVEFHPGSAIETDIAGDKTILRNQGHSVLVMRSRARVAGRG